MKVDEIRDRFLKFFKERGHTTYPSDSLVPANDPTLLFTSAGMNQFKEEFLGRVEDSGRAATCQKCLRTGDLENVGKTPDHHTFFEMLGNFSFGDYFKKEAIAWAWEFLTEELGLKESDLWVSVYKDDEEACNIWKDKIKVSAGKILKLGEKENFWPSNAPSKGPNGPCGPCSEIFYGGPEGVEVWNLVFTQFDRKDTGKLNPLPNKNIDTGMGLERIARVMQGKKTNFEIDTFLPIIDEIVRYAGRNPGISTVNAIADHIRAVTFAIGDGVLPSNEKRGYVIRKLIRRAFWYGRMMGTKGRPFLYRLVPTVASVMKKPYPELTERREDIAQVLLAEEERFGNTIQEGTQKLSEIVENASSSGIISGESAFRLYDTYGFPLELTQEIAAAKEIEVDIKGFEKCMEEQRAKSRKGSNIKSSVFEPVSLEEAFATRLKKDLESTAFVEDKEEVTAEILMIIVEGKAKLKTSKSGKANVFLSKTNFYGEKGGQVGDRGWLIKDGKEIADVANAIDIGGIVQHEVKIKNGELKSGDRITVKIDINRRENIRKNHTATHILHNVLRKVLGEHVKQSGSLVAPDRLRFDFTHFKALTAEELSRIEQLVNKYIKEDASIETRVISFSEAKKLGAIALFGEKYTEVVRMVSVGDYSRELCGGTHVKHAKEISIFKVVSESSIASGVRRIEAVTGEAAYKKIKEEKGAIEEMAKNLRTTPEDIVKKIEELNSRLKEIEKALEGTGQKVANYNRDNLLGAAKDINGSKVIVAEARNLDMALLRGSADAIKKRIKKGLFVLMSEKDGKFSMVMGVCGREEINAVNLLNDIGSSFGIKGGGRSDFAQAGGPSGPDIKDILKKAEEVIAKIL